MPKRVTIIGAGYIAMELQQWLKQLAQVTVVLHGDKARAYHQPYVQTVISDLESKGVKFVREIEVEAIVVQMVWLFVVVI